MTPVKPTLQLLRSLSDEHVLRALIDEPRLTRAGLATRTGLSKPTVSDSVRRLTSAGLVRDTGERTTGRGRVGTYYTLADDLGYALVVSIDPAGVVAETVDVHGAVVDRHKQPLPQPSRLPQVRRALRTTVGRAHRTSVAPLQLAVVSAADPVDRASGRLVHLPDAPFLLGALSPAEVLAPFVAGPSTVDNDVHWAARAERDVAAPGELDNFAYLHLGQGLGCAIVSDGEVRRGHHGIAGEISHITARGSTGRPVPFTHVFAELRLRRRDSTAIDTDRLLAAARGHSAAARRVRVRLAHAVSDVLTALVALTDPGVILIGGTWGTDAEILNAIVSAFAQQARNTPIKAAQISDQPSLTGARNLAVRQLRAAILASRQSHH